MFACSGAQCNNGIERLPIETPLDSWLNIETQPGCKVPDSFQVDETIASAVAQSWLWGSQLQVKKNSQFYLLVNRFMYQVNL